MKYEIVAQPSAEREIHDTYLYLLGFGGSKADDWLDAVQEAFESLEEFPERCAYAPENAVFRRTIRQLVRPPYRIVFTIVGDDVRILHVRHRSQPALEP
ncbi:MAG: plasmid stabilization system protein [Gemmatimonadetes bacterium]|nr:plasmid stabilization system protein [Gemmatimonadota bacterium]